MNIAETVKKTIEDNNLSAFGLDVAYGVRRHDYKAVRFANAVKHESTRNGEGRCIRSTATYEDDSVLEYTYNARLETYKLTVIK